MEKIENSLKNNISSQRKSKNSPYDNTKAVYVKYVKKMDKSDFANALTRYQVEHNMLKSMYNLAIQEQREDEMGYINQRYDILSKNFKRFGIVLKKLGE